MIVILCHAPQAGTDERLLSGRASPKKADEPWLSRLGKHFLSQAQEVPGKWTACWWEGLKPTVSHAVGVA